MELSVMAWWLAEPAAICDPCLALFGLIAAYCLTPPPARCCICCPPLSKFEIAFDISIQVCRERFKKLPSLSTSVVGDATYLASQDSLSDCPSFAFARVGAGLSWRDGPAAAVANLQSLPTLHCNCSSFIPLQISLIKTYFAIIINQRSHGTPTSTN